MTSPRLYNCRCIRNPEIIPNRSSGMYGRTITATATGPTPPARPQTIRAVLSRSTCDRVAVTYSYISDYWSRATFTFAGQEAANGLEDKQPAKPSNFHSTSIKKIAAVTTCGQQHAAFLQFVSIRCLLRGQPSRQQACPELGRRQGQSTRCFHELPAYFLSCHSTDGSARTGTPVRCGHSEFENDWRLYEPQWL